MSARPAREAARGEDGNDATFPAFVESLILTLGKVPLHETMLSERLLVESQQFSQKIEATRVQYSMVTTPKRFVTSMYGVL